MHKFELGKTYFGRSVCDYDCVQKLTVQSRTEKSLITDKGKRLKIYNFNNSELVYPNGQYSMAIMILAEKIAI